MLSKYFIIGTLLAPALGEPGTEVGALDTYPALLASPSQLVLGMDGVPWLTTACTGAVFVSSSLRKGVEVGGGLGRFL